jgi:hypothetical protein
MNVNAKQINSIDYHGKMDNTTVLGFFIQQKTILLRESTLLAAMGAVWTAFTGSLEAFDDAYAQARKWIQTSELEDLDKLRDGALSAFLNALKAMQSTPNAVKQQAARYLMFIRDKYTLSTSDEYMKETTAISQFVQEIEGDAQAMAALATTGLDDWLTDLKTKNDAFLAKMNERTEAQAGQQKGIVRERRLAVESAYRNLTKLINAMAICEVPAGFSFTSVIDLLNSEIEHYRQIIARKGGGGGSSQNNGGGEPTPDPSDDGGDNNDPVTPTPDPDNGGGDNNGGGENNGGGSDDNGGGGDNGGGDDGGLSEG